METKKVLLIILAVLLLFFGVFVILFLAGINITPQMISLVAGIALLVIALADVILGIVAISKDADKWVSICLFILAVLTVPAALGLITSLWGVGNVIPPRVFGVIIVFAHCAMAFVTAFLLK